MNRDFPDEVDQEDMYLLVKEWKLSGGRKLEYSSFGIFELYEGGELVAVYSQRFDRNKKWEVVRIYWKRSDKLLGMHERFERLKNR